MQTKLAGLAAALNVIDVATRVAGILGAAYAFATQMPSRTHEAQDDARPVRVIAYHQHHASRMEASAAARVRMRLPEPPVPPIADGEDFDPEAAAN
jgi:hypothetical protein